MGCFRPQTDYKHEWWAIQRALCFVPVFKVGKKYGKYASWLGDDEGGERLDSLFVKSLTLGICLWTPGLLWGIARKYHHDGFASGDIPCRHESPKKTYCNSKNVIVVQDQVTKVMHPHVNHEYASEEWRDQSFLLPQLKPQTNLDPRERTIQPAYLSKILQTPMKKSLSEATTRSKSPRE